MRTSDKSRRLRQTVSIVGGCRIIADVTGRSRLVADAADGADGIFPSCTQPDDPIASSAFTTERDLNTQHPHERLRATEAARERAGIFGIAGTVPRSAVTAATSAKTQQAFSVVDMGDNCSITATRAARTLAARVDSPQRPLHAGAPRDRRLCRKSHRRGDGLQPRSSDLSTL
jgi:hypothetical protein